MLSKESLTLLGDMGAERPTERLQFPSSLYNFITARAEVEDQVKFLILAIDHIIDLMDAREQMNSVKWNYKTVEDFLIILRRQSYELRKCVDQYQKSSHKKSYESKIKRQFRTLKKNLNKNGYSAKAWEQIRGAVETHLKRMDIIASKARESILKV